MTTETIILIIYGSGCFVVPALYAILIGSGTIAASDDDVFCVASFTLLWPAAFGLYGVFFVLIGIFYPFYWFGTKLRKKPDEETNNMHPTAKTVSEKEFKDGSWMK